MKIGLDYFSNFFYAIKGIILLALFLNLSCNESEAEYIPIPTLATHQNGMEYIGIESCIKCHKDIVTSHKNTPHHQGKHI